MPSFPVGMNCPANENAMMLSNSVVKANAPVAPSLPRRIFERATGLANSGSSDCRSRSPAVVSMARAMPPMKAPRMKKYGSIENIMPPRACAVDWSRSAISSGRVIVGEMPRATRRRVLVRCA